MYVLVRRVAWRRLRAGASRQLLGAGENSERPASKVVGHGTARNGRSSTDRYLTMDLIRLSSARRRTFELLNGRCRWQTCQALSCTFRCNRDHRTGCLPPVQCRRRHSWHRTMGVVQPPQWWEPPGRRQRRQSPSKRLVQAGQGTHAATRSSPLLQPTDRISQTWDVSFKEMGTAAARSTIESRPGSRLGCFWRLPAPLRT